MKNRVQKSVSLFLVAIFSVGIFTVCQKTPSQETIETTATQVSITTETSFQTSIEETVVSTTEMQTKKKQWLLRVRSLMLKLWFFSGDLSGISELGNLKKLEISNTTLTQD